MSELSTESENSLEIRFWGVRGSIPSPGLELSKYGGNTSCIEIRVKGLQDTLIFDAGSGIRKLANKMLQHAKTNSLTSQIFLSHTHWDHIMGFPFFIPAYIPGTKITIHGPITFEDETLEQVVGKQMTYKYFPINMGELSAEIQYKRLNEHPSMEIAPGVMLQTKLLNHPVTTLGYRLEVDNKVFCTCFDHEPFRNLFLDIDPEDPFYSPDLEEEGQVAADEQNASVRQFLQNADIAVIDAQYTKEEYESSRIGWGHTPIEIAIREAQLAGVKKLILFHHDPDRTDDQLDALYEELVRKHVGPMEIVFAQEQMEFYI